MAHNPSLPSVQSIFRAIFFFAWVHTLDGHMPENQIETMLHQLVLPFDDDFAREGAISSATVLLFSESWPSFAMFSNRRPVTSRWSWVPL